MDSRCLVIGVHLTPRVAWLALVSPSGDLLADRPDRLEVGAGVDEARGLAEFEESFEELIRTVAATSVVLLKPGSSRRPPRPTTTIFRGRVEGAIFIASSRSSCQLVEVSHQAVEKLAGVRPTDESFSDRMSQRFQGPMPKRWNERAPAFGAALAAIEGSP